jgi:hypothetical protein
MRGYDVFYEAPGVIDERVCQVCGSVCDVERNRLSSTSWAGAMAKVKTLHDYFYCPHCEEDWHEQALELVQTINTTPSKRLAALLRQDLDELLNERGCVSQTATVTELAREIEKARLEAGLSIEELLQILREEREKEE